MTQPDTYKPGDLVIIDDKFTGEITEHLRSYNGSHMDSWRVEVDSGKERHEHWIIAGDRMDHFVRTPEAAAAACNAAHAAESGDVSGPCALPAPVAERARLAAILTQRAPHRAGNPPLDRGSGREGGVKSMQNKEGFFRSAKRAIEIAAIYGLVGMAIAIAIHWFQWPR